MAASQEFDVINVLGLEPSKISLDYVNNKKQFQLHHLITEQRHQKTYNLSEVAQKDVGQALEALLSVDEDITAKLGAIAGHDDLSRAVSSVQRAIMNRKKIYFYGCGATGRLSKQMESSFWRPFWEKVSKTFPDKPELCGLQDLCIGEMTGGDRALISSLEGLEDLQLVGELQLQDHGIQKGDVVFAITEGGETSSVIGTIRAARRLYSDEEADTAKENLFFIFNNPENVLQVLDRSKSVLDDPGITKIPLWTGPQAVTGSTRMQATTSETFLAGMILEQGPFSLVNNMFHAIEDFLKKHLLEESDLAKLGFSCNQGGLAEKLLCFKEIQQSTAAAASSLSKLTEQEAETYAKGGHSMYWANTAMVTVFTDSTERSPTFRLFPLDTVNAKEKKCWIRVVTPEKDQKSAWMYFLKRPFKGMASDVFKEPFETQIDDPYLRSAALASLEKAGNDQEALYDFSSAKLADPKRNDIGIVSLLLDEKVGDDQKAFLKPYARRNKAGLIFVTHSPKDQRLKEDFMVVPIVGSVFRCDPLLVRQHIGLKMVLNAHSTAVMAKLGKLVGNTMTNVSPANLKLIGRATALILMHVNDALSPHGYFVSYEDVNAVLYDVIRHTEKSGMNGKVAEVAASIVLILEAFKRNKALTWEEAFRILDKATSLEKYLMTFNQTKK